MCGGYCEGGHCRSCRWAFARAAGILASATKTKAQQSKARFDPSVDDCEEFMQPHTKRAQPDEEGSFTGLMLFYNCQHVAWRLTQAAKGPIAPLSGAQLFYCTGYALLRRGIVSELEPDTTLLPTAAAQAFFFQIMPSIARWLAADYGNAVNLRQPTPLQRWRMVGGWLRQSPQLHQELARRSGMSWALDPAWPTIWERFWQQTEQEYAAPHALLSQPAAAAGGSGGAPRR